MHRVAMGIGIVAFGLRVAGMSAVVATTGEVGPGPRTGGDGGVAMLVPAYFYPGGERRAEWDRMAEAARSIPLEVILNPASGPGTRRDTNYAAVLEALRRSGARILAYVDSDYGRRPLAAVEKDLRTYPRFYEIDGYFIDQMSNRPEALEHYRSIRQLIRGINPHLKVVGNPGTYTSPGYLDTADTLVTFEGSARDFADYDPRVATPWVAGHAPQRFAAIIHDMRAPSAAREAMARAVRSGAGSVYITDQRMPNPYLGLPRDWADQVAAVRAMNGSRQPAPPR